jgi:hypothetical protein
VRVSRGPHAAALLEQEEGRSTLDSGDQKRYTALHVAAAGGHTECVALLLKAGCDPALRNEDGLTGKCAPSMHQMLRMPHGGGAFFSRNAAHQERLLC